MKTFIALLLPTMALAQYTKRSPPFELIVLAPHNATLNGSTLDACHEGAAIEGFCRGPQITSTPSYGSSFYFNTSTSNSNSKASDVQGVLSYDLVIADNTTVPSSMYLVDTWTSNVAVPILSPGYDPVTEVYFDAQDFMYILSTQDDTVSPAGQKQEKVKQWYVCTTYYGYTYDTLAWTVGKRAKPQNPTCQKVEVKRVWV